MEPEGRTYFLANVCHVCKSKNASYTCEICKMIFYCTPDHRRSNWLDHSQFCWAINKLCEGKHCEYLWELHDGKDFTNFKHEVTSKCTELLKRSLKSWELEMIYHPRVCNVCGEFNWKHLSFCKNCELVCTCQKGHFQKNHIKWCKTMQIYSELIIYLSLGGTVDAAFYEFEIKNKFFESMVEALSQNFESKDQFKNFEIQKTLTSDILTYPLTVLHAVRITEAVKKQHLEILFIGAEIQAEIEPLSKWEKFLLHHVEEVKVLSLIFLGPELHLPNRKWAAFLCENCRKQKRNLKFEFISEMFYHEYSSTGAKQPDLICAFNSGMYREFGFGNENSWKETIQKLFKRGSSPVLITEYTSRELNMVLEKIGNLCEDVTLIAQPKMNPYASLKPGLNIISEDEVPVIFKNYFYVLLQKT